MLEGENYATLCPTYSACFLTRALFPGKEYHHVFRVYDPDREVYLCKDLEIHTIELSKFTLSADQVKTPLERWCYFCQRALKQALTPRGTLLMLSTAELTERLMQLEQQAFPESPASS